MSARCSTPSLAECLEDPAEDEAGSPRVLAQPHWTTPHERPDLLDIKLLKLGLSLLEGKL